MARATVETTPRIEVQRLARLGYLTNRLFGTKDGVWFGASIDYLCADRWHLELGFQHQGPPQRIPIVWSRCHYGGARPWFRCSCGKRVGVLFWNGFDYRCRVCCGLLYESQRCGNSGRRRLRSTRIRQGRLHCREYPAPIPRRPYRMHKRTYDQLVAELEALERGLKRVVRPASRRKLSEELDRAALEYQASLKKRRKALPMR